MTGPSAPRRAFVIVLDSVGAGELPDAARYGDEGSNTLGNIARLVPLRVPTLRSLGLDSIVDLGGPPPAPPRAAVGRLAEASAGKDSVTGHWELMGLVLDRPFPTFPDGFPPEILDPFEARIGRTVLGNVVASGTEIIDRLGEAHMASGRPIVYTSADSVFQIAAHEDVIPVPELYRMCEIAFEIAAVEHGIGRVIARPFVGVPGAFTRTANRHDYAQTPTAPTLLDRLTSAGVPVVAIGKIADLFAGRGITRAVKTGSDREGVARLAHEIATLDRGFVFVNLVDFDTQFGHRNDPEGYAANLEAFDGELAALLPAFRPGDLVVVTADHGNDPTTPSTDHSREYVPVLMWGGGVRAGANIGTRASFADLAQTLAEWFGIARLEHGMSFLPLVLDEERRAVGPA